jgi:hypothetical protein
VKRIQRQGGLFATQSQETAVDGIRFKPNVSLPSVQHAGGIQRARGRWRLQVAGCGGLRPSLRLAVDGAGDLCYGSQIDWTDPLRQPSATGDQPDHRKNKGDAMRQVIRWVLALFTSSTVGGSGRTVSDFGEPVRGTPGA